MRTNPVLEELGTYPIAQLQERARAMRATGQPLIDFSIGDPIEPTPEFIREALRRAVPAISQYPTVAGLPELRRAIADYLARRLGVTVDAASQVLPTSGSKEAIFSTPLAFIERGSAQAVVWAAPAYPVYERGARFGGAEGIAVRLEGDFVLRPEQIPEEAWRRARLLWVNYPHNPTGAVVSDGHLRALVERAREAGVLLLSDECYLDVYESEPPPSVLQVAGPSAEGVLIYLSLSKRSGMTGYRSGAIVGDARAIEALRALRSSVGVGSPEFIQLAAAAAWSDDAHVAERRAVFSAKRAVLRKAFEAMGFEVVGSQAGIYLWVEVGDDATTAARLLEAGVVVSPGGVFGPGGEGYLRLALVPSLEECEAAVEVLRACLES
ncbi:MAG: aminotransferase class I/II-fold pyridoxal phosphate-dependent enzyme [Acidimicrobiia bacterium]